ncbi:Putative fluoride ion transporter CrcB [Roseibaca ekhonensis]|uniref:Fluoride-specific ion channel FluC n=1 Tax=Roseinatronobacter ekhonensis TaxID=254356 RepID=A0A3B0MGM1_9RHOB|nr:CrcB family protein [Roseibaca ekhonensis]SUZ30287.1 Putative fluoride ion transporter CrcB [Roseibaca ekhonensis]
MMAPVALGAALGAAARAGLWWLLPLCGTLLANVAGSVLIGMLASLPLNARGHAFAMTGFCGGFTTFSLFGLETLILLQAGDYAFAALYVVTTLALSLGGAALGLLLGKRLHLARNTPRG